MSLSKDSIKYQHEFKMNVKLYGINVNLYNSKWAYIKYIGRGDGGGADGFKNLQIFQKKISSPGDHMHKYYMAQ